MKQFRSKRKTVSFNVKFVQTDACKDGPKTVKQYAPDLSMWGHIKQKMLFTMIFSFYHIFKFFLFRVIELKP